MRPATSESARVVPLRAPTTLLVRLRRGEASAAAELLDRHTRLVERAVHGVMGFDPDAEDVVQEAFIAALRGIDGFRGDDRTLGGWVRGIAVRLALKKIRWRRARRWLGPKGTEDLAFVPTVIDTDTQVALQCAYALLERLPSMERAVFGLRMIEGMRLEEVAETVGISLATTKRRLRAARERFGRLAAKDALLHDWLGKQSG